MTPGRRGWIVLALLATSAVCFGFATLLTVQVALGHDADAPELDTWYAGLMQPDNPTASCCGKADAYWCDDLHVREGKTFCTITDDREVVGRPHMDVGTVIEIPPWKLKWDRGNPTGHAVVFLSIGGWVYCFVQAGGA